LGILSGLAGTKHGGGGTMRIRFGTLVGLALAALAVVAVASKAQEKDAQQKFLEQLTKNRYALTLESGKVSGPGMNVLSEATSDAEFVLVGEDHGIRQIPQFMGTVFEMLAPRGFHTLAIETGPSVTPPLAAFASQPDGAWRMKEFDQKYPDSVAFYEWQEEFAFLQRCARATKHGKVDLWGLDQEFMGATGYLLSKILDEKLGQDAKAAAERMMKENDDSYAAAAKTGDPTGLFMMAAKDEELASFAELLKKQGTPPAKNMLASLVLSRDIYKKNMGNEGHASNRERSLLMKENFKQAYTAARTTSDLMPKVMFKFGAYHMYRGFNKLRIDDIGDLVAELADWNATKSVHILIVGVKGTQLGFAGIGKPYAEMPLDLKADKRGDFSFLAPMFDDMLQGSWTLYDLRPFRSHFSSYEVADTEMERMIFGYDFLVLVPDPEASHEMP